MNRSEHRGRSRCPVKCPQDTEALAWAQTWLPVRASEPDAHWSLQRRCWGALRWSLSLSGFFTHVILQQPREVSLSSHTWQIRNRRHRRFQEWPLCPAFLMSLWLFTQSNNKTGCSNVDCPEDRPYKHQQCLVYCLAYHKYPVNTSLLGNYEVLYNIY